MHCFFGDIKAELEQNRLGRIPERWRLAVERSVVLLYVTNSWTTKTFEDMSRLSATGDVFIQS